MEKVIVDIDTGIDDALAIILAIKSKELDILGFTTVSGNVNSKIAELNTRRILKLYNREDIEVYPGAESPLVRPIEYSTFIHGEHGLAGQLTNILLPKKEKLHGVDFIINTIRKNSKEVSLVMLGPLTNLSLALRKAPDIKEHIKSVIVMGGAVNVRGNITPMAEFNIYTDPESADIVLNSGLDIKLIPLDITEKAILRKDILKNIDTKTDQKKFVYNILSHYLNLFGDKIEGGICAIHDPLALSYLINPKMFKLEEAHIKVEKASQYSDGKTILYPYERFKFQPNVMLGKEINLIKFLDIFINRVIN